MKCTTDLEVEGRYPGIGGRDIGAEVGFCDVFGKGLLAVYIVDQPRSWHFLGVPYEPWVVSIAARIGFASSNVRVERAMNACRNARWLLL